LRRAKLRGANVQWKDFTDANLEGVAPGYARHTLGQRSSGASDFTRRRGVPKFLDDVRGVAWGIRCSLGDTGGALDFTLSSLDTARQGLALPVFMIRDPRAAGIRR